MKKEIDVVAALIKNKEKILLCQRKKDDSYGGLWEFPGGSVEEGENLSFAIKREIKEELDLAIEAVRLINDFTDESKDLKIKVFLFFCVIKSGEPKTIECQNFIFFTLDQIRHLDLAPVDKKIFDYIKSRNI
ncbi:MAG: (deoxy)nucleoside triphosphate pyrophosphohydrolase [Candidatus Omnitrophica bacterium]|jgi:8-oxo-dGTP diphosphatase|nr:(deoxy)nucleoside triphosphate pyrophosphohydrolase [Candidatus Omnitrophota bacterium]